MKLKEIAPEKKEKKVGKKAITIKELEITEEKEEPKASKQKAKKKTAI